MKFTLEIRHDDKNKFKTIKMLLVKKALETFVKQPDVAEWLGISVRTLRYWIYKNPEFFEYRKFVRGNNKNCGNLKWEMYPDD